MDFRVWHARQTGVWHGCVLCREHGYQATPLPDSLFMDFCPFAQSLQFDWWDFQSVPVPDTN